MPAVSDSVWSAQDTTPTEIDAALRNLLVERHAESASYVPARVLNLVCVVDREWSGEIANRLRGVGSDHPSRTIVCAVVPGQRKVDAVVMVASDVHPKPGVLALTRETVILHVGPQHLEHLDRLVDPLVVTDLPTMVWSPHGHPEAVDALQYMAQVVLLDSVDEPELHQALHRASSLTKQLDVVDLAWLRSLPWRERTAGTFDPEPLRPELRHISSVTVRHHADSAASGLLFLGWMASRLQWRCSPLVRHGPILRGSVHARRQDVALALEPTADQQVRGLAGLTLETASGRWLSLDRGPGGLRAHYRSKSKGTERQWTVLGASRGEGGILGEGLRQALARDRIYAPALTAAEKLLP